MPIHDGKRCPDSIWTMDGDEAGGTGRSFLDCSKTSQFELQVSVPGTHLVDIRWNPHITHRSPRRPYTYDIHHRSCHLNMTRPFVLLHQSLHITCHDDLGRPPTARSPDTGHIDRRRFRLCIQASRHGELRKRRNGRCRCCRDVVGIV